MRFVHENHFVVPSVFPQCPPSIVCVCVCACFFFSLHEKNDVSDDDDLYISDPLVQYAVTFVCVCACVSLSASTSVCLSVYVHFF